MRLLSCLQLFQTFKRLSLKKVLNSNFNKNYNRLHRDLLIFSAKYFIIDTGKLIC